MNNDMMRNADQNCDKENKTQIAEHGTDIRNVLRRNDSLVQDVRLLVRALKFQVVHELWLCGDCGSGDKSKTFSTVIRRIKLLTELEEQYDSISVVSALEDYFRNHLSLAERKSTHKLMTILEQC